MPDVRGQLLPIYVLADESGSMRDLIGELNTGLKALHAALLAEPMAAAKVRFTLIGFSDTAVLRMHLADLRHAAELPTLGCRAATSYGAAFHALQEQIPADIQHLKGQGYEVHRPAVFFLSDGQPSDGNRWFPIHDRLVDRAQTIGAPNIIACGIGEAKPPTILRVATRPEYAFVSIAGADVGQPIARFCAALTRSIVKSSRSMADGRAELYVDRPEGFHMAIDVV
ncbi:vWA domain-containing protein [Phytohabitans kaempferiae]|uniref:VWFA domain-containing protein n=1 Tax=Phytohabitans kaempferiae TaxID=1620943 RepID=A0ABV6MF35_9ACTN